MATYNLGIKNGLFVTTNKKTAQYFEWECKIQENGDIHCETNHEYHDGIYTMRYHIEASSGFEILTLQTPKNTEVIKESFVVPKNCKIGDGILRLSNGPVYKRSASFKDCWYQDFLKRHGLSTVNYQDPNRVYKIRNAQRNLQYCQTTIETDGIQTRIKGTDNWGKTGIWRKKDHDAYEYEYKTEVSNATWVIVEKNQDEKGTQKYYQMLYTLQPLKELQLP